MNGKVLEAVSRYNMINRGDRLAVGLSGGADSVALAHILRGLAGEWGLTLSALHLNHRLRGAESERDEAFVRALCARWGLPLVVESAPVGELARQRGMTVEQCARELRYAFFRRNTPEGGKICTAHTLSDNAETALINLTRGTGLRGLGGIPPVRGNIVRPLILCARGDVEAYCRAHGLDYVTDSTNGDGAFTRNRIRRDVLPVLRELNPGFLDTFAGNADVLRADADFLDGLADEALDKASTGVPDRYDREALLALPGPLLMRALAKMLQCRRVAVDRRRLEGLRALLEAGSGAVQVSAEWTAGCDAARFSFVQVDTPAEQFIPVELDLSPGSETVFSGSRSIPVFSGKVLRVTLREGGIFKGCVNNNGKALKNTLDCDRIGKIARLRQREPGDAIRLAGRGCTKSLKKLYNEAGLPIPQRRRLLVLAGEDGLLWAEGFGAAEAAQVREDTRRVLIVDVLEDAECMRT